MSKFLQMKIIKLTDKTAMPTHFVGTLDMEEALNSKVKKVHRRTPRNGDHILFKAPNGEIVHYVFASNGMKWVTFSFCCGEE